MRAKSVPVQAAISLVPNVNDWNWIPNANISSFGSSALMIGNYNATPYYSLNATNMTTLLTVYASVNSEWLFNMSYFEFGIMNTTIAGNYSSYQVNLI